jgi:hypothetical protein
MGRFAFPWGSTSPPPPTPPLPTATGGGDRSADYEANCGKSSSSSALTYSNCQVADEVDHAKANKKKRKEDKDKRKKLREDGRLKTNAPAPALTSDKRKLHGSGGKRKGREDRGSLTSSAPKERIESEIFRSSQSFSLITLFLPSEPCTLAHISARQQLTLPTVLPFAGFHLGLRRSRHVSASASGKGKIGVDGEDLGDARNCNLLLISRERGRGEEQDDGDRDVRRVGRGSRRSRWSLALAAVHVSVGGIAVVDVRESWSHRGEQAQGKKKDVVEVGRQ